ncbi:535_t:CDS:2, partial [Cetraspora pellucida]
SDFNKETNAEGTKELFFKCGKNTHPIWNYFKPTSDKKFILCNLCPETKYSIGTGISTIKWHFESNHKSEYHQLLQLSLLQAVEYYGVRDEKKIKKLNDKRSQF